ncbi:ABC-three component system middle component 5 [Psychrobacter alimentarius]|uniref:ABC-three component system middle component 5 n=1 Tax=Psychrobacter alimentarius TaxID=261164 RepID=UPI003FD1D9D2
MIYHPRNDVYHCCYRIISILKISNNPILTEQLRMIDFYLVFPNFAQEISFPRGNSKLKNRLKKSRKPFEEMPNKKILFYELKNYQSIALSILRAKSLISIDNNIINKTSNFSTLPKKIFENSNILNNPDYNELIKCLLTIETLGENGLKKRTGLMEYRYDAI